MRFRCQVINQDLNFFFGVEGGTVFMEEPSVSDRNNSESQFADMDQIVWFLGVCFLSLIIIVFWLVNTSSNNNKTIHDMCGK